jgi:hypothetical protein
VLDLVDTLPNALGFLEINWQIDVLSQMFSHVDRGKFAKRTHRKAVYAAAASSAWPAAASPPWSVANRHSWVS